MRRIVIASAAMSATMLIAACSDGTNTSPSSQLAITMASTYSAAPAGFSSLTSSFATSGDEGPFMPGFGPMGGHGHGGFEGPHGGPGFGLGFMGGGLFGPFLGDGVGPFFHSDSSCTYASGTLTCNTTTRDGLTVKRTYKYTTAAGVAQQKRDMSNPPLTDVLPSLACLLVPCLLVPSFPSFPCPLVPLSPPCKHLPC